MSVISQTVYVVSSTVSTTANGQVLSFVLSTTNPTPSTTTITPPPLSASFQMSITNPSATELTTFAYGTAVPMQLG